jgi:CubicO group peptidase (beta-lactamase class C family)
MTRFDDFDAYIRVAMESWHCPGAAVAVVRGDEVLYQAAHGWSDAEQQLELTVDSRFAMASVTKSFTAMSAALLVDECRLDWDKPVREYMPEFILNDACATRHVTLRDMLSHRTGLPRHDLAAWRLDVSRAEFIGRMRHFKFNATFREKYQYNNLMYYATAYLVEKIAGQKWEDFVRQRIFEPLGMAASSFGPEPPAPGLENACGYQVKRDDAGRPIGLKRTPFGLHTELSPGAAGGLFSTLADLTRWLSVHANEGRLGDFQLVSPDNLKQMHLPQTVIPGGGVAEAMFGNTLYAYAMGWRVEPYAGRTLVQHGGNVEGHSLMLGLLPREKIGVVALTNIGLLPLRDVLLYDALDRALGLPDADWNARFHAVYDPLIAGEAAGKQTAAAERVPDAPPAHPLESYLGDFEADGYPDFAVRLKDGQMQARLVGSLDWTALRHYHYDVFEWHLADFDYWSKVRFLVDNNGQIASVAVPVEPAVDDVVFKRKPPRIPGELLAALAGRYETEIAGLAFAVTASGGKVFIAQSGMAPREVRAYRLSDDCAGFLLERARFDFQIAGGAVGGLAIKLPGQTLQARRAGLS